MLCNISELDGPKLMNNARYEICVMVLVPDGQKSAVLVCEVPTTCGWAVLH